MKKICVLIAILAFFLPVAFCNKVFVLVSQPGSGKGTFSQYFVKNHGYVQICAGDLLREEVRKKTPLGKKVENIILRGEYVDNSVVCRLIASNIDKAVEQNKPFIVDGFPRQKDAFEFLLEYFEKHKIFDVVFVQIVAKDSTCMNRILRRLVCNNCKYVYSSVDTKTIKKNICNYCKGKITRREADTKEIVKKRLKFFHSNIEPLLKIIKKYYPVKKISSECSIQDLERKYEKLLEEKTCKQSMK